MSRKYIKATEIENGVKVITTRNVLREKAGFGGIEPLVLERAEEYIQNNQIDFNMYAQEYMVKVGVAIDTARSKPIRDKGMIADIIRPIMGLKAGGGMFKYTLITEISDIMLNFLESTPTVDDAGLDILGVYQKIMNAIIAGKLTGTGGESGRLLADELYSACNRYTKRMTTKN